MSNLSRPLLLTDQFLQLVVKSGEVEAVANSVVDLHRQWDTADPVFLLKFAESEDGQKIVIALLQVQVESIKGGPWNHGNGNTELIQMQFDRFCESSLTHCFGKYIFPWCSPDVDETTYSKELLGKIISDVDAQLP